jgi:hypothetical protein
MEDQAAKKSTAQSDSASGKAGKQQLSQSNVPRHTLQEALRVPQAIADQYGKQPASPVEVGQALGILPTTGHFRSLAGAALAYGLTEGGAFAERIGLGELGRRIVAPMTEGDDAAAMREALLRPRIIREFLQKYDGSPLPTEKIGRNVLETMGVPAARTQSALALIVESAEALGLLTTINGRKLVNLRGSHLQAVPAPSPEGDAGGEEGEDEPSADEGATPLLLPPSAALEKQAPQPNRRVFISHGSNKKIVAQVKELLQFGDFDPVVTVENETTAKPVPKKVLDDMRSCGAGLIHVGNEQTLIDKDGNEHHLLNQNVLTEIGGAMALWDDNFVLLVEEGVKLPSNLQGLYEVRYTGEALDHEATMKLLRTFKQFKS